LQGEDVCPTPSHRNFAVQRGFLLKSNDLPASTQRAPEDLLIGAPSKKPGRLVAWSREEERRTRPKSFVPDDVLRHSTIGPEHAEFDRFGEGRTTTLCAARRNQKPVGAKRHGCIRKNVGILGRQS
jgi:hypothetical protein